LMDTMDLSTALIHLLSVTLLARNTVPETVWEEVPVQTVNAAVTQALPELIVL